MPLSKIYKIKNDKLITWQKWCRELETSRKEEALETIKEEAAILETFINFQISSEWYTLGLAASKDNGELILARQDRQINQDHKRIKQECLELITDGEIGYFLTL